LSFSAYPIISPEESPVRRLIWLALSGGAVVVLAACSSAPSPGPTAAAAPTSVPTTVALNVAATPTAAALAAPASATLVPAAPAVATQAATSGAATAGGSADAATEFASMAQAWSDARSYRMVVQTAQQGAQASQLIELVKPDREHFKMTAGPQTIEQIRIGQDSYTNANGQWTKTTSAAPLPPILGGLGDAAGLAKQLGALNQTDTVTKGAVDTINGDQCQEWQYVDANPSKSGAICIGLSDKLPRQMKVGGGQATITFSDWNAPISIEPPV
jgi:hypothetical protein